MYVVGREIYRQAEEKDSNLAALVTVLCLCVGLYYLYLNAGNLPQSELNHFV